MPTNASADLQIFFGTLSIDKLNIDIPKYAGIAHAYRMLSESNGRGSDRGHCCQANP